MVAAAAAAAEGDKRTKGQTVPANPTRPEHVKVNF